MRERIVFGACVVLAGVLALSGSARGVAPEYDGVFMEIEGVPGDSLDSDHLGWIQATAYADRILTSETLLATELAGVLVTKKVDKATPKLMHKAANGELIPEITIELVAEGQLRYKVVLEQAVIFEITTSIAGDSEETIGFAPERVRWSYTEYDRRGSPVGTVSGCWNFDLGISCGPP